MTADNAALVARLDDLMDEVTDLVALLPNRAARAELMEACVLLVRASNRLSRLTAS